METKHKSLYLFSFPVGSDTEELTKCPVTLLLFWCEHRTVDVEQILCHSFSDPSLDCVPYPVMQQYSPHAERRFHDSENDLSACCVNIKTPIDFEFIWGYSCDREGILYPAKLYIGHKCKPI